MFEQTQIKNSIYRLKLVGANDYVECIVCGEGEIIEFEQSSKRKKKFILEFEEKHKKLHAIEEKKNKQVRKRNLIAEAFEAFNKPL